MIPQKQVRNVFLYSFFITLAIFILGIFANYGLDFVRINALSTVMADHELSTDVFLTEQLFIDHFGGNICEDAPLQVQQLRDELQQVGLDLSTYTTNSWINKKDFDFLKRKYFLLELRLYVLLTHLNKVCDSYYVPILYFYEVDDKISERQGFVLEDISESYNGRVIVLSFDKDYEDEPLIEMLANTYNVTTAPTIIIHNQYKEEGMHYVGQINATLLSLFRTPDPYAPNYSVFSSSNISLLEINDTNSTFLLGEQQLVRARQEGNASAVCLSLPFYDQVSNITAVEQALLYETFSSLGCGRNKKAFYQEAEKIWKTLNMSFRAELAHTLSTGKTTITFPLASNLSAVSAPSQPIPPEGLIVQQYEGNWHVLTEGVLTVGIANATVYHPRTRFLRKDLALIMPLLSLSQTTP